MYNNASMCTSVSQWERTHVHALCVSYEQPEIKSERQDLYENFSKDYGKLESFIQI